MGKRKLTSLADVAKAMKLADGDYGIAAKILGGTVRNLRKRVWKNRELRTVWARQDAGELDELDVTNRTLPPTIDASGADSRLADAIRRQDLELMRSGLGKAGVGQETLDMLRTLDDFAPSSGRYLVATLDLSHKMMSLLNVKLMEEALHIQTAYLHNERCPPGEKIEWQKAFNEICELLGRGYDRNLTGTNTLAKIMAQKRGQDGGSKRKAGFSPLE